MPRKRKDITGQRFERLVAIEDVGMDKHKYRLWKFICDCGTEGVYQGSEVWRGFRKSCGCYIEEQRKVNNLKHGHRGSTPTPTYRSWQGMHSRCSSYKGYERISVCKRWGTFENFLEDMGERPSSKHSIDRINNNGNYSLSNCRWATATEQNRNTSKNVVVTWRGEKKVLKEVAEIENINYATLHDRYRRRGWSLEESVYGK